MADMHQPHPGMDFWEQRFSASDEYVFGTEPNEFLASKASLLSPGMHVLSIADGEGRNGVWLARQGLHVRAVDGSLAALAKSRRLAEKHGVTLDLVHADLTSWEWCENCYDAIVGIFIQFTGPRLRQELFGRAWRALKPGGILLLQGYRPEQLQYGTGGPSTLENLYTEAQLRTELKAFSIEEMESKDVVLNEGSGHHGMSAVINVVARKG